jgi:argininosuccinate lyase
MTDARLGSDALAVLEPGAAVRRRTTPGGAGPGPVRQQLEAARARLTEQRGWLEEA